MVPRARGMYGHRPRGSRRGHIGSYENSPDIQTTDTAKRQREALTLANGEKGVAECWHTAYIAQRQALNVSARIDRINRHVTHRGGTL
eukprot:6133198-Pleurochrysis_carterae.AAC.1